MLADSDSSSDSERTLSDAVQEARSDSGPPAPASSTQDLSSAHSVTQIDSEATLTDPAMRDMRAQTNRVRTLEQTALTLVQALGLPIDVPDAEVGQAIKALARRASERAGAGAGSRSASVRSASSGSASVVGGGSGAVLAVVGDGSDGVAGAGAAGDAAASEGAAGGAAEGAAGSEGADGGGRGRKRKSPPTPRSGSPNLP